MCIRDRGYATGCRRDAGQLEFAEGEVIFCKSPLTLHHMDLDTGLPIGCCREYLALPRGNGSIAFDQLGCNSTQRLYTQRERGDIEQDNILSLIHISEPTRRTP